MVEVIPGIYDNDIAEIRRKISLVAPYVKWVQLDLSDGSLVPNQSLSDVKQLSSLVKEFPALSFEAHLMVSQPEKYTRGLSAAGFKRIVAHIEANDPRLFLEEAQYESVEVGLAIDGPTEIEEIEPFLDEVDFILVMTAEMGASNQPFQPETVEKIKQIHENLPDLPIEVDCGMNEMTARIVREAGATRIVTTSFIFGNHPKSVSQAVKLLSG